jgi:SAM-dependent methyltransferase
MVEQLRLPLDELLARWTRRVGANYEQVGQYRETPEEKDFYAPVAARFRQDPRRQDEPALNVLRTLIEPTDTWLDIGAGGGRYSLPIALLAKEVIALDVSQGMLAVLREGMAAEGVDNVRIVEARWPAPVELEADVSFISHVGYDIKEIGPFVDAMEAAASRLCVAMLFHRQPTWPFDALWPAVHGVERATLPALPDFLALLIARGRPFEVRLAPRDLQAYESLEEAQEFGRRQTWVQPGSAKDQRLREALEERLIEREGKYAFSWEPGTVGIVSWRPR